MDTIRTDLARRQLDHHSVRQLWLSLMNGWKEILQAPFNSGDFVGPNVVALVWIAFELILFSMPTELPVTPVSMNYASVVFMGFLAIAAVWYVVYAR